MKCPQVKDGAANAAAENIERLDAQSFAAGRNCRRSGYTLRGASGHTLHNPTPIDFRTRCVADLASIAQHGEKIAQTKDFIQPVRNIND